ncbi:YoaK family protein [Brucella gallinifaecis]|uniref:DUF1275 domain-containing protein n=1 Tax=Brucella gallinifaecis TaxID=215590 RepID=A0A502BMF2_9HYPH|nr:YoaK family protein [Brucella gallinifaecis]TPF75017.1 DUF1275 domain-containing protein [Brucella gallinifaecis]
MTPNSKLSLGLTLTGAAGFVDGIAFMELGGFFASFMSGNTTQLGLAIARQPDIMGRVIVWLPMALVGLFFAGAFLGTLAVRSYGKNGSIAVMAIVALVLVLVCVLRRFGLDLIHPVLMLAAAMGAQNAAVQPIGSARLGVTYVTGTLFNSAADLAGYIRGDVPRWRWLQHFSVWLSLMTGALCGGLGHSFIGLDALLIPAVMIAVIMVTYWRIR